MKIALLAIALAALPGSGAISFSAIQTEFARGGANPVSASEYIRGGTYVLTTDTNVSGIPTTLSNISINGFHGAARTVGLTVTVTNYIVYGSCSSSTGCTATTATTTCSATGGNGSYTYTFPFEAGTGLTRVGTGATASWSKTGLVPLDSFTGYYHCHAVDTATVAGDSAAIEATVENVY